MIFLKILKNAEKCVFGRENQRRSSRERASERVMGRGPSGGSWQGWTILWKEEADAERKRQDLRVVAVQARGQLEDNEQRVLTLVERFDAVKSGFG